MGKGTEDYFCNQWHIKNGGNGCSDGNINEVKVLEKICCINSKNTIVGLKRIDEIRIKTAESAAENFTRGSRKRKRSDRRSLQDEENNENDPEYGAGLH